MVCLRSKLEVGGFEVFFSPIYDLTTNTIMGINQKHYELSSLLKLIFCFHWTVTLKMSTKDPATTEEVPHFNVIYRLFLFNALVL